MSNDIDHDMQQRIHDAYDSVHLDEQAKDAMLARLQAYQTEKARKGETASAPHADSTNPTSASSWNPEDVRIITAAPATKRKRWTLPAAAAAIVALFAIAIGISTGGLFTPTAKDTVENASSSVSSAQEAHDVAVARTDPASAEESAEGRTAQAGESAFSTGADNDGESESIPPTDQHANDIATALGAVPGSANDAEIARAYPAVQTSDGARYELVWQGDAPLTLPEAHVGDALETISVISADREQEIRATVYALDDVAAIAVVFEEAPTVFVAHALLR